MRPERGRAPPYLKLRIDHICRLNIGEIKVLFAEEPAETWIVEYLKLKPKHQRDFSRLLALTEYLALLNADHRGIDTNHDITATNEDAEQGRKLTLSLQRPTNTVSHSTSIDCSRKSRLGWGNLLHGTEEASSKEGTAAN